MQYKLQLSVNKSVLGTLDPEPGEYHVNAGEDLTVYALPDSINDARFVGWSDGETAAERSIVVEDSVWLTATFEEE